MYWVSGGGESCEGCFKICADRQTTSTSTTMRGCDEDTTVFYCLYEQYHAGQAFDVPVKLFVSPNFADFQPFVA